MRRLGVRVLMAAVGIALLVFYASAAFLAYRFLRWLWLERPDPVATLLIVGGLTVLFGYASYQFGTVRLLAGIDAAEIPRSRAPWLYDRIERLADRAGVDPPRLLIAHMEAPNALALGDARGGVLVFDSGLFRLLDADELEAIVAHELAHLEGYDGLVQTVAYSAVRMVVGLAMLALLPVVLLLTGVSRALAWIRGRPLEAGWADARRWVGGVVALVLVALTLLVRAHSRRREYAADDRAVELTGRPLALARALAKIERASEPRGLLATLYVHGDEEGPLTRMLSTHPPMDERIERLRRMAGERERGRRIEVR